MGELTRILERDFAVRLTVNDENLFQQIVSAVGLAANNNAAHYGDGIQNHKDSYADLCREILGAFRQSAEGEHKLSDLLEMNIITVSDAIVASQQQTSPAASFYCDCGGAGKRAKTCYACGGFARGAGAAGEAVIGSLVCCDEDDNEEDDEADGTEQESRPRRSAMSWRSRLGLLYGNRRRGEEEGAAGGKQRRTRKKRVGVDGYETDTGFDNCSEAYRDETDDVSWECAGTDAAECVWAAGAGGSRWRRGGVVRGGCPDYESECIDEDGTARYDWFTGTRVSHRQRASTRRESAGASDFAPCDSAEGDDEYDHDDDDSSDDEDYSRYEINNPLKLTCNDLRKLFFKVKFGNSTY